MTTPEIPSQPAVIDAEPSREEIVRDAIAAAMQPASGEDGATIPAVAPETPGEPLDAGVGVEGESDATPPGSPSDATATTAAPIDPYASPAPASTPESIDFFGVQLTRDEATQLAQLYQWATSLTPEQTAAIDLAQRQAVQQQAQPPAAQPLLDEEDDDPRYAELRSHIERLEQQVASTHDATAAQQVQAAAQYYAPFAERAAGDIAEQFGLTEADMLSARQKLVGAPELLERIATQTGGDPYATYKAAFETVVWTDPQLRERAVQQQAAAAQQQQQQIAQQKAKAGALAGSGGTVPRSPSTPTTQVDRQRAIVDELRSSMQQ